MKKRLLTIIILILCFINVGATVKEDFTLKFDCGNAVVKYVDLPIDANNHIVYEEIVTRKINAPLCEKKQEILKLLEEGVSEKQAILTCFPRLNKTFESIVEKVYQYPVDSQIKFNPNRETMFTISKEKSGKKVDEDAFYADVVYALFFNKSQIKIRTIPVEPSVTIEDNKRFLYKKSTYSTSLASSSQNRKHNVERALESINGSVLQVGEILSFNAKTGIRSEENGYKTAKIIVGNEYVDGVGGGVCQASTTLYNSALLAGLQIDQVSSHSLLPSYVEPSFDAMVNTGSSDLVIRNNTSGPIFIKAYVINDRATVIVYGCKNEYEIRKKSVTVSRGKPPEDKKIYDDKYFDKDDNVEYKRVSYSQPQLKSEGYLLYYRNGVKHKEEKIREDNYNSKSGIIAYRVENKTDALIFL